MLSNIGVLGRNLHLLLHAAGSEWNATLLAPTSQQMVLLLSLREYSTHGNRFRLSPARQIMKQEPNDR